MFCLPLAPHACKMTRSSVTDTVPTSARHSGIIRPAEHLAILRHTKFSQAIWRKPMCIRSFIGTLGNCREVHQGPGSAHRKPHRNSQLRSSSRATPHQHVPGAGSSSSIEEGATEHSRQPGRGHRRAGIRTEAPQRGGTPGSWQTTRKRARRPNCPVPQLLRAQRGVGYRNIRTLRGFM